MNLLAKSLRLYLISAKTAIVIKVFCFWAFFWLVLAGLQTVPLQSLGSAASPIGACIAIVATLLLIVALLRIDRGSLYEIGLSFTSRALPQFVLGIGLGVALVAAMVSAMLLLTPLEIESSANSNFLNIVGVSFVVLLALAMMEELAFRSYSLFELRQAWGIRPAVYVTSIAFAFYHGLAFENLLGPGVWGIFFGWMAISTNSIARPTGFHMGLNWLQALMGMKPEYSKSVWDLSVGTSSGYIGVEELGLVMQVVLLVAGISIVELLVARQSKGA
ncbi:MAG TPA: type II CAAX endopeptidase family protein [Woeseiaceae bacterium]|nr:type II CAAX endopeptidase family protein [Woeseiaceae bacterium]